MSEFTPETRRQLEALAAKHGLSVGAAEAVLRALAAGGGGMAQFNHPELGGMGQWSPGMTMIGDMFNAALKAKVEGLCADLVPLAVQGGVSSLSPQGGSWWPAELGAAASSGGQNDWHYAYFPAARRLAVQQGGRVRVYDTGDHVISGVSQQQGASQSLQFATATGSIRVEDLREVG